MKTIKDFEIVNGVAVLKGVAYADEAKVVDAFLKENINIAYASVIAKDGRYFELNNGRLVYSNRESFSNPYYSKQEELKVQEAVTATDSQDLEEKVKKLEQSAQEVKENYLKVLSSIAQVINTFLLK